MIFIPNCCITLLVTVTFDFRKVPSFHYSVPPITFFLVASHRHKHIQSFWLLTRKNDVLWSAIRLLEQCWEADMKINMMKSVMYVFKILCASFRLCTHPPCAGGCSFTLILLYFRFCPAAHLNDLHIKSTASPWSLLGFFLCFQHYFHFTTIILLRSEVLRQTRSVDPAKVWGASMEICLSWEGQ